MCGQTIEPGDESSLRGVNCLPNHRRVSTAELRETQFESQELAIAPVDTDEAQLPKSPSNSSDDEDSDVDVEEQDSDGVDMGDNPDCGSLPPFLPAC